MPLHQYIFKDLQIRYCNILINNLPSFTPLNCLSTRRNIFTAASKLNLLIKCNSSNEDSHIANKSLRTFSPFLEMVPQHHIKVLYSTINTLTLLLTCLHREFPFATLNYDDWNKKFKHEITLLQINYKKYKI